MFAKVWTSAILLLAICLEVHGHAAVAPVLGVSGDPSRRDVRIPTAIRPCGLGVNVANALGKSTPVQAAPDGTFTTTITNFNPGRDGSRQVTAQVDAAATGKRGGFVDMTVTQNGDAAPPDNGSQQIVASLPAGTKCTGGASGDICLVSFKTLGRFGNCVAVQQAGGGSAAAAGAAASGTGTSGTDASGTDDSTADGTATGTGTGTGNAGAVAAAKTNGKSGSGKTTGSTKAATGKTGTGQANQANSKVANNNNRVANNNGKVANNDSKVANNNGGNRSSTNGRTVQGGTRAARALLADLKVRGGV